MSDSADAAPMTFAEFTQSARKSAATAVAAWRAEGLSQTEIEKKLGRTLPAELQSEEVQIGGVSLIVMNGSVYPLTAGVCEPMPLDELRSLYKAMNDSSVTVDERVTFAARIAPFFNRLAPPA